MYDDEYLGHNRGNRRLDDGSIVMPRFHTRRHQNTSTSQSPRLHESTSHSRNRYQSPSSSPLPTYSDPLGLSPRSDTYPNEALISSPESDSFPLPLTNESSISVENNASHLISRISRSSGNETTSRTPSIRTRLALGLFPDNQNVDYDDLIQDHYSSTSSISSRVMSLLNSPITQSRVIPLVSRKKSSKTLPESENVVQVPPSFEEL